MRHRNISPPTADPGSGFTGDLGGARAGADGHAPQRPRDPVASAGFGSPGSDFTVRRIDFNEALIRHPQATFVMRMSGDAMADAGIWDGDALVVDRAVAAGHGHVVVARWDGELVCRRLVHGDGQVALVAAGPQPERLVCSEAHPLEVWGVVTFVIHPMQI